AQERHWVASVARKLGKDDMGAIETAMEARAAELLKKLDEVDAAHSHDSLFELFVPDGSAKVHKRLQDVKAEWNKTIEVSHKGSAADITAAHTSALAVTSDFVVNYVANYSN